MSAIPIIFVVVLLLVGSLATTLVLPGARSTPPPTPFPTSASLPAFPEITPPPAETPLGRYPTGAEAGLVTACVSGIDAATVPGPIAQAFCVCTINKYEQLYPTYEGFQSANAAGAITDQIKTDVANRCAQQIVGG